MRKRWYEEEKELQEQFFSRANAEHERDDEHELDLDQFDDQ